MYAVFFSRKAQKSLAKIPTDYQVKIKQIVASLTKDPFTLDLKKMHSSNATHRLRYGSYRLFLYVDKEIKKVIIADIERRTTHTYRKR